MRKLKPKQSAINTTTVLQRFHSTNSHYNITFTYSLVKLLNCNKQFWCKVILQS